MRQFSEKFVAEVAELVRPVGDAADDIFTAVAAVASSRRGRPVHLRKVAFPPSAVSGVWLDLEDKDIIAVQENTDPEHQCVILGHELWHMFTEGHHKHETGTATRAHSPGSHQVQELVDLLVTQLPRDDSSPGRLHDAVLHYATRTDFDQDCERQAERFGLTFGTHVTALLTETALHEADGLAGRIEASLGHRGFWT